MNVYVINDEYSYIDDDTKKELINAGIGTATAIGTALASKQRQLSNVEQMCGKKPKLGRRKKEAWQECVNRTLPKQTFTPPPTNKPQSNNNKTLLIVGGSIVGLALITILILKLKK